MFWRSFVNFLRPCNLNTTLTSVLMDNFHPCFNFIVGVENKNKPLFLANSFQRHRRSIKYYLCDNYSKIYILYTYVLNIFIRFPFSLSNLPTIISTINNYIDLLICQICCNYYYMLAYLLLIINMLLCLPMQYIFININVKT